MKILNKTCSKDQQNSCLTQLSYSTSEMLRYKLNVSSPFCYRRAILTNPDLLSSTPWHRLLQNDFWGTPLNDKGSHGSYRPLCVATFRLNYLLGGLEPWGYHLVNVALHAACTVLVVKVARKVKHVTRYLILCNGEKTLLDLKAKKSGRQGHASTHDTWMASILHAW